MGLKSKIVEPCPTTPSSGSSRHSHCHRCCSWHRSGLRDGQIWQMNMSTGKMMKTTAQPFFPIISALSQHHCHDMAFLISPTNFVTTFTGHAFPHAAMRAPSVIPISNAASCKVVGSPCSFRHSSTWWCLLQKSRYLRKKTVNKILTKTRVCWAQGSVRFCEPETALPCSGCSQSWACWWRRLALELCTSSHINQPESRSASPKHHHHLYHHHHHHHHHHQQHYLFPYMLSCCHRNTRHWMTRPRAHVQVIMKSPVLEFYALIFSSLGCL